MSAPNVERLAGVAESLIHRLESSAAPTDSAQLAGALVDVLRATAAAYELEAHQRDHLPVDVKALQQHVADLVQFLDVLHRDFMAGDSPTSLRIAARIRSAIRDVLPSYGLDDGGSG